MSTAGAAATASNMILSLLAMGLSSITTYLTFFDARYTLTAAIASVEGQIQTSGGSAGEGIYSVEYRPFVTPSIILSNHGTRALVVTNVDLVKSTSHETCQVAADAPVRSPTTRMKPMLVEAGSIQEVSLEFGLPETSAEKTPTQPYQIADTDSSWCLKWVLFDPDGERHEPTMLALRETTKFSPEPDSEYHRANYKLDHPKGAAQLLKDGLF
jgi:hypothetical protein